MDFRMQSVLVILFVTLSGTSSLKCITCSGDGPSCRDKGKSTQCPETTNSTGEGLCGRVNYIVNGTSKVVERCALKRVCVGTIDCKKDKFEFAKRYPGATNCVVSCCQGDDCNPQPALKCYECKGEGKTCSQNSVSCGYGDDRCIRINFKVNGTEMMDERCYQSSRCANQTEICDSVRGDYPSASNCQSLCCQGDHCNDDVSNKGTSSLKCITCSGDGPSCRDKGKSTQCPGTTNSTGEGLCGRVNYMVNGTSKVVERCALKRVCVGTIDCKKDKFEFAKRFPGATNCVVSCCQGDDCNPQPALKCHECKGEGITCSQNSVSCGYGDDRCIRINFKVNGTEMVDERCYQSSRCANQTEICDSVRGDYPSASNCQSLCCQGDHCNDNVTNKGCTLGIPFIDIIASCLLLFIIKPQ